MRGQAHSGMRIDPMPVRWRLLRPDVERGPLDRSIEGLAERVRHRRAHPAQR